MKTAVKSICLSLLIIILASCTPAKDETNSSIAAKSTAKASARDEAAITPSKAAPSSSASAQPQTTEIPQTTAAPSIDINTLLDGKRSDPGDIYDASGFVSVTDVIPDAILDIRYYSEYNFIGDRVRGYEEPVALLSKEAAAALREASDILRKKGYRIKIFDAYRPQTAVDHFVEWAEDIGDTRMKKDFYPDLDKSVLFDYGYIARYSGHSRGCTVDMTLFDMNTGKDADMGGPFDYFGELSHPDYTGVTEQQYNNRMILRDTMQSCGFSPCGTEWWDFRLIDEPYPDTYFSFPVSIASLTKSGAEG